MEFTLDTRKKINPLVGEAIVLLHELHYTDVKTVDRLTKGRLRHPSIRQNLSIARIPTTMGGSFVAPLFQDKASESTGGLKVT
jgi:hypothetical protein